MLQEFKKFALEGNMLDMAVGIVLGAAFATIVTSMVNDVIMPPIGLLVGGVDFSDLFVVLSPGGTPAPYATLQAATDAGAVTLNYGRFLNTVVNFILVAGSVFFVIRGFNRMRRKKEDQETGAPPPSRQEELLAEIRDLLRSGPDR